MKPVKNIITLELLEEQASRSSFRLGTAIAEQGKFVMEKENPFNIFAKVSHKSKQSQLTHVESTPKGLKWKCSCTNRKDVFCEHCVALGLRLLASSTPST